MKEQKRFIWVTQLNSKGQIVIPAQARKLFNLNPGDNLLLFGDVDRGIAIGKQSDYLEFANAIFNTTKGDKN